MVKLDDSKIYDAHTHFNDAWYQEEKIPLATIISEAMAAGVGYFNNVGFSLASSQLAIQQVEPFANAFAIIGVHPNEVNQHSFADLVTLKELTTNKKVVGIGEVGLDYFYSNKAIELQQKWFRAQIEIAQETKLPLMMHLRDQVNQFQAYDDALMILKDYQVEKKVVHCFSANKSYAQKFLDQGCYLEIGGAVTFKNAKQLQEAVKIIPLERMLVETDAPYLTPDPLRGRMNFSKYLGLTVAKIAQLKEVSPELVIEKTTQNAFHFFLNQ